MAKTRGGLGRGLNSLLGSSSGEAIPQEPQQPARIAADTAAENGEIMEESPESAASVETSSQSAASEAVYDPEPEIEDVNQEISEDNVTIKGVVSRRAVQPPAPPSRPSAPKDTVEVPLDRIEPNPDQPRTNFKKEELEELAESIKKNGLLQPVLVRSMPNGFFQIIAGERRWQACKLLKLDRVPVRVLDVDDDKAIVLALIENIQRSDLNPIEEAYGYRRMMERGKMTQAEVAQAVSKGRSTIANALRLLELPEDAQKLLFEERITAGHARAILSVPTQEGRRKLTDKLIETPLSVRETESMARLLSGKKEKSDKPHEQAPKSYKTVARALGDTLGTQVKIKSIKGKNKIEIDFKDEADLERLFRMITTHS